MTAGIFDQLTNAFVNPITGGFGLLSRYALPLLALLGLIYLLLRLAEWSCAAVRSTSCWPR